MEEKILALLLGMCVGVILGSIILECVQDKFRWLGYSIIIFLCATAFLMTTGCVQVHVASTAVHGEHYATSEVQAGYGEGSTFAQASETTSTATASRSANTVDNLGAAGIGALIGSGWLIP